MAIEINNGHLTSFRRAVYLKDDVAAGTVITANDLITLRPNNGIDARDYYTLIGKKAAVNIKALEKLSADMFE
jgi:N,N'-diacetyllegionaminate synthase